MLLNRIVRKLVLRYGAQLESEENLTTHLNTFQHLLAY